MVNLTKFSPGGTRVRASRLVFAQWFQPCQSYPDRMHLAKIYCPRAFTLFSSMYVYVWCAPYVAVRSEIFPRTIETNITPIYIIYRKFHLKLNWQKRRIVSINFGLHADYNLLLSRAERICLFFFSFFFFVFFYASGDTLKRARRERGREKAVENFIDQK